MKNFFKKLVILGIIFAMTVCTGLAASADTLNVAYEAAAAENYYLSQNAVTDGTLLSEYLALVYSGFTIVENTYLDGKEGVELLATDIITNTAEGRAADTEKTAELASLQKDDGSFGSFEETCLAMIALKASKTVFSSEQAVQSVLSYQDETGLFYVYNDLREDIEATALALSVLSPYVASTEVFTAVQNAVERLNEIQNEDGTFAEGSCITLSKVISALSDIGESTNSELWKNIPELLVTYKNEDGSYREFIADETPNAEATAEALCAFHALASGSSPIKKIMTDGKLTSFDISDIIPFLIFYAVLFVGSVVFWIYALRKKQSTRTLDDTKKAYELC